MGVLKLTKMQLLAYGLPLLIILSAGAIALSPLLKTYPELTWAITLDLTLTAPLLFLLVSRNSKISKTHVIPIFLIGIAVATYLIPKDKQLYLNYITTYLLPLVELFVLFFIARKVYKGLKVFKSHAAHRPDFYEASKISAKELFGNSRFGSFLTSEITMVYYAFSSWRKRKLMPNEYSNYKESGSIPLAGAFLGVILIETAVIHILLVYFGLITLAWILTLTSLYMALMIFAHIRALIKRPSVLTDRALHLKNGLIADINIDLKLVEKIELQTGELPQSDLKIGNLGFSKDSTNHSIALYFKSPQTIEKMYGFTQSCELLLFHLDNKNEFVEKVKQLISG